MNGLLIILAILQIIAMVLIIYTTYVRHQHNKNIWKQQEEISEEFLKQLNEQPAIRLDEGVVDSEQENPDKK